MRRHFIVLWLLVFLPFGALIGVNAYDYLRFQSAIRRAERLNRQDWAALADHVRAAETRSSDSKAEIPRPWQVLRPLAVTSYRGSGYANLYQHGEVYLQLNVDNSANNQRVYYFTNSGGPQRRKLLWERSPEFTRKVSPGGRVVTVTQWRGSEGCHWIVLPDRILVVEDNGRTGDEPTILAEATLDAAGASGIREVLQAIGSDIRGHDFRCDAVADGIGLHINFTASGENGDDSIGVTNTWVPAIKPLLDAISQRLPAKARIRFTGLLIPDGDPRDYPATVRTLAEWKAISEPPPKTPWWSLWRSFQR